MSQKKYSFHDKFWWWLLGVGIVIVSYLVQVCLIFAPFLRVKDAKKPKA